MDWEPLGHVPLDEGEIEHVDDFAVEKFAISVAPRLEVGYLRVWGGVEDESVEEAVDDVACCSCCYEGEADDVADWFSLFYLCVDEPSDAYDGDDAEEREEEFASEQFPSECHAVVFDEHEAEPTGDFDALP